MEQTQLDQFKLLKALNPNISTIFYHDSARAWTLPNAINVSNALDEKILRAHPDWYLRNLSGSFAIDPYEPGWEAYDGAKGGCCEVYDLRQPEVRKAWMGMGLGEHYNTSRGIGKHRYYLVDGVFGDYGETLPASQFMQTWKVRNLNLNPNPNATWKVSKRVAEEFALAHIQLFKEATAAVGPTGGVIVQNGGPLAKLSGNAYMFETFAPNNQTINALFQLRRLGKVVQAHTDYYSGEKNPCQYDSLAAFLIGASPYFYWSGPFGWDSVDEDDVRQRWLPEFDKPLGPPQPAVFVPALKAGEGTWRREFGSGTVVEFRVEPYCIGTIKWADGTVTVGLGGCDATPTPPPGR